MKPIWELHSLKEAATRPEFYRFMTLGLKDLLFKAYREARVTYPMLVTFQDSMKDKEGYPSLGALGLPQRVLEGEPYQERSIPADDMVEVTNHKFGEIIAITQELVDDDQTNQIKALPLGLGNAHAKQEDKVCYSIINGNATGYDSQNIFSLNHPGYTGGAAIAANDNIYTSVTLSANAVAVALGIIAGWTGHATDDILDVTATDLVVPQNLGYTAELLTKSNFLPLAYAAGALGPGASVGQASNVLKDVGLGVVKSARLDQTSTTDWYIKTDFPGLVFQWREKLAWLAEDEKSGARFERDVMRWKSRARWRAQMINWRWGMKVS